jgi:hypothetical protein
MLPSTASIVVGVMVVTSSGGNYEKGDRGPYGGENTVTNTT